MTKENVNKVTEKVGKYRWTFAALLLFSTTINYMDRNVIGFLKDYMCSPEGFGWTSQDFSYLTSIFTAFYAGFTLVAGWIIDKIGTKLGLACSLILWSVAGILSAFMGKSLVAHCFARSLFGAGEAGNFPSSIKAVAEWFPKKERALATGIFNSGSNIGAMICAIFVPWCLLTWGGDDKFLGLFHGWQAAFIITGVIGFLWLIFWGKIYKSPKEKLSEGVITQAEFDYINQDDAETEVVSNEQKEKPVSWGKMLTYKQTWSFAVGKFLTDGIWWFLLFWLPTYVKQQFFPEGTPTDDPVMLRTVMITNFIVFGVAIVGSVYGGSIPLTLMNKGMETYKARMTSLLMIAFFPILLLFTQTAAGVGGAGSMTGLVLAIAIIALAGAAHQAWSANLFSTVSDMFPKKAVGTVTGIGTAMGGLGGVLIQLLAGYCDAKLGTQLGYTVMFTVCAVAYLLAWAGMKLLVPKFQKITDL